MFCHHKHCGKPVHPVYASFKYVEGEGMQPFHEGCRHAHPDYDVSLGLGSPFTTIHLQTTT